jgi:hypothetical protein
MRYSQGMVVQINEFALRHGVTTVPVVFDGLLSDYTNNSSALTGKQFA